MSRVRNSLMNLLASSLGQILQVVLRFITRTVFISTLGTQYLGITGLFSNILSMLSLAELGVGAAITFNLYKPIADGDTHHVALLMKYYRKAYRLIGLAVGLLGLIIMPFLPAIVKDDLSFINVNLIFLLYLLDSVASYLFFAYKGALIRAHQKEYIITFASSLFSVVMSLLQIVMLTVFHDFTLYVAVIVVVHIVQNIYIARRADALYPYIKEKTKEELPKSERTHIRNNCSAIFIYKINTVVQNATDNIVLSTFIGLEIVGVYSNYLLIVTTIKNVLNKAYSAIRASLGDLHAQADTEHELFIFKVVGFFTMCSFGLASVGTFTVANEFIDLWIGSEYVLPQSFVGLLAIEIYLFGLQKNLSTFRTTMGLFQQVKYRPIFSAVINLGLSVLLVQYIGIHGVLIGTIVSSLLTFQWFDPYVIYKNVFKRPVREYYVTNLKYACLIAAAAVISRGLAKSILDEGLAYVLVACLISVAVTGLLIYIFYRKSPEFAYMLNLVKKIIGGIGKKVKRR